MEINFYINNSILLDTINDSMELDSGTTIADMNLSDKSDKWHLHIGVYGDVVVDYKDERYKSSSRMPEELIQLFHDGNANSENGVEIIMNNWFEIFIDRNGVNLNSEVIDCIAKPNELLIYLFETYLEYKKEYESAI